MIDKKRRTVAEQKTQPKVDVILYRDGILNPIEIKKSTAPKDAIKNFSVLKAVEKNKLEDKEPHETAYMKQTVGTGAVVCMASDVMPIDKKNWYIPAWLI